MVDRKDAHDQTSRLELSATGITPARARLNELPDAEWYFLYSRRSDYQHLYGMPNGDVEQVDPDPSLSAALRELRVARCRSVYTDWKPQSRLASRLYDDASQEFDSKWLMPYSQFVTPIPDVPIHFDVIVDFACEPDEDGEAEATNEIVSAAWKNAIEALEPNVHDFYSHELRFTNGVIRGCYIVRNRQALDVFDQERSKEGSVCVVSSIRGRSVLTAPEKGEAGDIAVRRDVLTGRHWVQQFGGPRYFFSRELAILLKDMLPEVEHNPPRLVPVTVVD